MFIRTDKWKYIFRGQTNITSSYAMSSNTPSFREVSLYSQIAGASFRANSSVRISFPNVAPKLKTH